MSDHPMADRLREAQRRLDEAAYEEDVAYAMLRKARGNRERAAEEVIVLQERMIDALRTV